MKQVEELIEPRLTVGSAAFSGGQQVAQALYCEAVASLRHSLATAHAIAGDDANLVNHPDLTTLFQYISEAREAADVLCELVPLPEEKDGSDA